MPGKNSKNKNKRKSERWQKQKKKEDAVMNDPLPTDLVIPLIGLTGVGKSTFINKYFNDSKAEVGNNLTSCTQTLAWYTTHLQEGPFEGRRLVLVDTPGFDDTYESDSEILRRIGVWLAASYSNDMSLAGVLYLHDIGQRRMQKSTRMNVNMFERLVGTHHKGEFPTIALVTTQWDTVPEETGAKREEELKQNFWKDAITQGAGVYRASEGAHASIVQDILQRAQITKNAKDDETRREEREKGIAAVQAQRDALHVSFKDRVWHWLRMLLWGN